MVNGLTACVVMLVVVGGSLVIMEVGVGVMVLVFLFLL